MFKFGKNWSFFYTGLDSMSQLSLLLLSFCRLSWKKRQLKTKSSSIPIFPWPFSLSDTATDLHSSTYNQYLPAILKYLSCCRDFQWIMEFIVTVDSVCKEIFSIKLIMIKVSLKRKGIYNNITKAQGFFRPNIYVMLDGFPSVKTLRG